MRVKIFTMIPIRLSLDKDKDTVISPSKPYKSEMALRDAVTVCVRMAWR